MPRCTQAEYSAVLSFPSYTSTYPQLHGNRLRLGPFTSGTEVGHYIKAESWHITSARPARLPSMTAAARAAQSVGRWSDLKTVFVLFRDRF